MDFRERGFRPAVVSAHPRTIHLTFPWHACTLAVCLSGALLSGCASTSNKPASPPLVSAVFQNKAAYLHQAFTPDTLSDSVRATLAVDNAAPAFHRITVNARIKTFKTGSATPQTYESHTVYEDLGKGLIRAWSTTDSNGFNASTDFWLAYHNYVGLLAQRLAPTASSMPMMWGVEQLNRFQPALSAETLSYSFQSGHLGKPGVSQPSQLDCQLGKTYEGSVVNAAIPGHVREMECQFSNANGVVTEKRKYVYLQQYGFALVVHMKSATKEDNLDIVDFKVE